MQDIRNKLERIKEEIADIEIPAEVANLLLIHQTIHVQNLIYVLQNRGVSLDCSDTGSGKSYGAAAVGAIMKLRLLIIGPKAGIPSWYEIGRLFGISILGNVNYETLKNGKYYSSLENFHTESREKCPYIEITRTQARDSVTGQLFFTESGSAKMVIDRIIWKLPPGTLVVFDEAHKCRNGLTSGQKTANSQLMVSVRNFLDRAQHIYGLFLSATLTDKLENFDVIAYILGLYRPYQPKIYKQFLSSIGSDPMIVYSRLHQLLFPRYASRMDINEIKKITGNSIFRENDIQATIYKVNLTIAAEIENEHKAIKEALQEIRRLGLPGGWGRIIRCWRKIEVLKIPTVAAVALKYLREGKSVVVFVNFNKTKTLLVEHILSLQADNEMKHINMDQIDFIEGKQTAEARDKIVHEFQEDRLHLLVCNIKAGGVAISLHDIRGIRQRVSLILPTWSATDLKQSLGRIYRANSKSDAIQRIVYCGDDSSTGPITDVDAERKETISVEAILCHSVNYKLENIQSFNNGDLSGFVRIFKD